LGLDFSRERDEKKKSRKLEGFEVVGIMQSEKKRKKKKKVLEDDRVLFSLVLLVVW